MCNPVFHIREIASHIQSSIHNLSFVGYLSVLRDLGYVNLFSVKGGHYKLSRTQHDTDHKTLVDACGSRCPFLLCCEDNTSPSLTGIEWATGRERGTTRVRPHAAVEFKGGVPQWVWKTGDGVSHLCSVPDNRRPGVAQFVSTGSFVIVDQEKVVLSRTHSTDKDGPLAGENEAAALLRKLFSKWPTGSKSLHSHN